MTWASSLSSSTRSRATSFEGSGTPSAGGLIKHGSTHAPAQERLGCLQSFVGCNRRPPLLDSGDDFNDIALGNLMNAPAGPGLANLPAKKPSDLAPGAVLRQTLRYEGLQQILDSVCHDTSPRRSLLGRRIAAFELRREHLLRRHARLMKGHAPIRPDCVLAQPRAGTAGAVENDEYPAAFGRDLDAESGATGVPVHHVGFWSR